MRSTVGLTTIARSVTAHVMTDGTIRVCEYDALGDLDQTAPVFFDFEDDALAYLADTHALGIDPDWYADE